MGNNNRFVDWLSRKVLRQALPGAVLLFFGISQATAQSGWTRAKGEGFAKFSAAYFSSDQFFNLNAEGTNTGTDFNQTQLALYGEYGITDRLTVLGNWPVFKWQGFETTETVSGTGDLAIGIKYGILQGKFPVSIAFTPEIPIGSENNFANNEASIGGINLPTGDGEWNFLTTLAASHSFHPFPAYLSAFGTFNYRTSFEGVDFRHQWRLGMEVGYQPVKQLWLRAIGGVQFSPGERPQITDFIRGEGTEFTYYLAGAYYKLNNHWGVDVSYSNYLDVLIARANIYSAGTFTAGIVYEWK